jgi:hypothetical protein
VKSHPEGGGLMATGLRLVTDEDRPDAPDPDGAKRAALVALRRLLQDDDLPRPLSHAVELLAESLERRVRSDGVGRRGG